MDKRWLREELARRGISHKALADRLGRHPSAVTRLLQGQRGLKAEELAVLSSVLDMPASAILQQLAEEPLLTPEPDIVSVDEEIDHRGRLRPATGRRRKVPRPRVVAKRLKAAIVRVSEEPPLSCLYKAILFWDPTRYSTLEPDTAGLYVEEDSDWLVAYDDAGRRIFPIDQEERLPKKRGHFCPVLLILLPAAKEG